MDIQCASPRPLTYPVLIATDTPAADTVAPQVRFLPGEAQRRATRGRRISAPTRPEPPCGALLVIAGAGSGKTNTLAHRVAHLLVKGADPHRILLLTFSRRAALEMTRRVTRIAIARAWRASSAIAQGLTWSGTFHGVGARLLRDYADLIGLVAVVHDQRPRRFRRSDEPRAARTGVVGEGKALSGQVHLLCDLLARGQYGRVARRPCSTSAFPWCREWEADLRLLFAAYVNAKQTAKRARL